MESKGEKRASTDRKDAGTHPPPLPRPPRRPRAGLQISGEHNQLAVPVCVWGRGRHRKGKGGVFESPQQTISVLIFHRVTPTAPPPPPPFEVLGPLLEGLALGLQL